MMCLWGRYPEVPANLPGHVVRDLRVARHGGATAGIPVHVDGVPGSLPEKLAPVCFEIVEERPALHTGMRMVSRTTSRSPNSVRVSSLLASSTSLMASTRLSRASSRVRSWALAPGNSST